MLEVVKKLSMVVTPRVTRAGSAFHSIQNVTKEDVTRIMPAAAAARQGTRPPATPTWHEDRGVVEPLVPGEVEPHLEAAVVPCNGRGECHCH